MRKKLAAVITVLLMLQGFACAEVYSGVTTAFSEIGVYAEADGILECVCAEEGDEIKAGDVLARYRTEKTFASQDGTVAVIHCDSGDQCSGTVLEIMPEEKYKIYCTVENAYQSPESTLVHSGEQVYVKCTADGTHRGIGIVTNISGNEYSVLTVGGEFHVGETVYLYRDSNFSSKQRVGVGTVVENDPEKYETEGAVVSLQVSEGEAVERGELLYETVSGTQRVESDIFSCYSGIICSINVSDGETVKKDQLLASVVPEENIRVEISVDETSIEKFRTGSRVKLIFAADRNEKPSFGTVTEIADIGDENLFRIVIAPDKTDGMRIGMTVEVFDE